MHASMLRRWLVMLLLAVGATPAAAQGYPNRPVRMIVPFTPAGATDVLARLVGEELGRRLGQPILIENRAGAGGNIGAQAAAKAPPDGYTLLMAPTSIYSIAMALYREPGFDLTRDFATVSLVANAPHVLVAHPSLQARNVQQVLALARASPGGLSIASQGTGTVSHLEAEILQDMAGISLVHVPYKGSAPALLDVIGGRVPLMFDSIASALPHIKAGKLVAVAVASDRRASLLPRVPTMAESGLPGYRAESWLSILVPAKTPQPVIDRLNRELVALLGDAHVRQLLVERGLEPQSSSPAQLSERIRADLTSWGQVVRAARISVE
jgi:tripartite-type tricarboxylate transporter receptor subunit TctC